MALRPANRRGTLLTGHQTLEAADGAAGALDGPDGIVGAGRETRERRDATINDADRSRFEMVRCQKRKMMDGWMRLE
jgi:hypothetical protein